MRWWCFVVTAAIGLAGLSRAVAAEDEKEKKPDQPRQSMLFERLDENKDGVVEASEVPEGAPEPLKQFLIKADKNGDKKLTKEELQAALKDGPPPLGPPGERRGPRGEGERRGPRGEGERRGPPGERDQKGPPQFGRGGPAIWSARSGGRMGPPPGDRRGPPAERDRKGPPPQPATCSTRRRSSPSSIRIAMAS